MTTTARADVLQPGTLLASTAVIVRADARALPADLAVPEANLFTWPMEISSDRLDSYYTRMDPQTTLPNYASDATAGVAFLAGHDTRRLPFGQTYAGRVEQGETGVVRVIADAYTVRGLELGGVRTDDFIGGVEARIIRDVSVGFVPGSMICSCCGRDWMTDWECRHWPGQTYEIKGEDGVIRDTLAWALVVDGRLVEVSAVYAGSTPGAAILKAEREIALGRADEAQIRRLEQQYRMRLPVRALSLPGIDLSTNRTEETPIMPTPEQNTTDERTPAEPTTSTPATEERAASNTSTDVVDPVQLMAQVRQLQEQMAALQTQAQDGQRYRETLVEQALAEGVRALGATFDADSYRAMLGTAPVATIERMRADWAAIASQRLPGGRATQDTTPEAPSTTTTPPTTPTRAFRA